MTEIMTSELRIGNFLKVGNQAIVVTGIIGPDKVFGRNMGGDYECTYDISMVSSVPTTEEWLTQFGFHSKYKSIHVKWTRFGGDNANYSTFELDQVPDEDEEGNSIPQEQIFTFGHKFNVLTVHQLQNLYFALMGQELQSV